MQQWFFTPMTCCLPIHCLTTSFETAHVQQDAIQGWNISRFGSLGPDQWMMSLESKGTPQMPRLPPRNKAQRQALLKETNSPLIGKKTNPQFTIHQKKINCYNLWQS